MHQIASSGPTVVRFGGCTLDLRVGELRANGTRVRLQEQSLQILSALLEHPGEVVTREELQRRLWAEDTHVDFEHGLNAAIKRLREALGDDADLPRFVETIPRRGYRFIAPVEKGRGAGRTNPWTIGLLILILASGFAAWGPWTVNHPPALRVSHVTQLTNTKLVIPNNGGDLDSPLLTDGTRLYFSHIIQGRITVQQLAVTGGDAVTIPTPFENTILFDLSADGSELLVGSLDQHGFDAMQLWVLQTTGGLVRRVGDIRSGGAGWSPDGKRIVYGKLKQLFVTDRNGDDSRLISDLACECSVFWPRWSPDGRRLRFTLENYANQTSTLWEVSPDGGTPHPVLPEWTSHHNRKGTWSRDGKVFVFDDYERIWVLTEGARFLRRRDAGPSLLTGGPLIMFSGAISPDGSKFFAVGERGQSEILRYHATTRNFEPYLNGLSAEGIDFSRDGRWIVYVAYPEGTLWRIRVDGTDRLQLTSPPLRADHPRWSPDGSRIAFSGQREGKALNVYTVNADGSDLQALPGPEWRIAPSWSPDGKAIAFAAGADTRDLTLYDLETRTSRVLAQGKVFFPIWSPDGRYIVSAAPRPPRLRLFDVRSGHWSALKDGSPVPNSWAWSRDARYIYLDFAVGKDPSIQRLRVADGRRERFASTDSINRPRGIFNLWFGLDSNDAPMILRDLSSQQIYAFDWERER